jgi:hypothetical protein
MTKNDQGYPSGRSYEEDDQFVCYKLTRDRILKDMGQQAEKFQKLQEKVTRKLAQGLRKYTDDIV